jgi:hypothetical protein
LLHALLERGYDPLIPHAKTKKTIEERMVKRMEEGGDHPFGINNDAVMELARVRAAVARSRLQESVSAGAKRLASAPRMRRIA